MYAGSSPLTRGKPRPRATCRTCRRLIPAHAGKTTSKVVFTFASTAHPRSRGENQHVKDQTVHLIGSSPLTRGKPPRVLAHTSGDGLIPAHAGKTIEAPKPDVSSEAHPRSRGENRGLGLRRRRLCGSSPLTRGKPQTKTNPRLTPRLIPAHAGKTMSMVGNLSVWWAHPRSRGENRIVRCQDNLPDGSSPLTRGKRIPFDSPGSSLGLIPAHAGKTGVGQHEHGG